MMKESKLQDERVLAERRKIQSRGYAWLVTILLISIIVQQFFMKAPFAQYAVEFFLLIGCGLYNIIANFQKGIDIWNPAGYGKIKILVNTIISGIASVVLFIFLRGKYQVNDLILYFVTFVAFFFVFRLIMNYINHKKLQALDKELDDDKNNE